MDPVTLVLVPGIVGGAVVALMTFLGRRHNERATLLPVPDGFAPPPTDVINAARIRVAGIGGLGLVAMAATVALNVPRIFQTMSLGLVLGAIVAGIMIARRRESGALPSSGRRTGATPRSIDPSA